MDTPTHAKYIIHQPTITHLIDFELEIKQSENRAQKRTIHSSIARCLPSRLQEYLQNFSDFEKNFSKFRARPFYELTEVDGPPPPPRNLSHRM